MQNDKGAAEMVTGQVEHRANSGATNKEKPLTRSTVPEEPLDYRRDNYQSPTPTTLDGATVISDKVAHDLWISQEALFIDVMPRAPRPQGLPADVIWRPKKRKNIPGSAWLVNVGYGALRPEIENYFRENLERLTKRDYTKPMVFYCLANCWMSWNAARRALDYGYASVYWYPDGTDGWRQNGGNLQAAKPVPIESPVGSQPPN